MTVRTGIVPVLVATGLLAAACSSSTSGSPSAGGPAVPSKATLKGIVVRSSDLPSGWKGSPSSAESQHDEDTDAQLTACVGTSDAGEKDQVQQVMSDDFTMGQMTISSDASSYKSEKDVKTQIAELDNARAQPCLSKLFRKEIAASLPSGATIRSIGIKLDTSDTGISNLAGTANGRIVVSTAGQTVTIYLGAAFFTGQLITGQVTFTSINTPITSSFANPIVKAVAKRAAKA